MWPVSAGAETKRRAPPDSNQISMQPPEPVVAHTDMGRQDALELLQSQYTARLSITTWHACRKAWNEIRYYMPSLVNCFVKYGGASGRETGLQQDEKRYLVLRSSSIAVQLDYRICCRGAVRYVFCPRVHRFGTV